MSQSPATASASGCASAVSSSTWSHDEARRLLTQHRKQLDALADALLARETLNEEEILEVTGLPPAPALETGMLAAPGEVVRDRLAAH